MIKKNILLRIIDYLRNISTITVPNQLIIALLPRKI
jgi:hypothetical protein